MTTSERGWSEYCKLYRLSQRCSDARLTDFLEPNLCRFSSTWPQSKKGAVLYGPTGRGKTHYMHALIRAVVLTYGLGAVRFFKAVQLDRVLLAEFLELGSAEGPLDHLRTVDFLFIDDFGVERATERTERDYFDVFDARWDAGRPTVLSTNLSPKDIEARFGDRIYSRLKGADWLDFSDLPDRRGIPSNPTQPRENRRTPLQTELDAWEREYFNNKKEISDWLKNQEPRVSTLSEGDIAARWAMSKLTGATKRLTEKFSGKITEVV